jgi:hypothetical protein
LAGRRRIDAYYGELSVWNWGGEPFLVSGHIEILAWNRRCIRLKERVVVNSKRDERTTFRGVRVFRREKPKVE